MMMMMMWTSVALGKVVDSIKASAKETADHIFGIHQILEKKW
jgi:hypothetical protein